MSSQPASTIAIVKKLWENTLQNKQADNKDWNEQLQVVYQHGRGLEETLCFLYEQRPAFETFFAWLTSHLPQKTEALIADKIPDHTDIDFFTANGYFVLQNAVSARQCIDAKQCILDYLEADLNQPSTWYKTHKEQRGLMLMLYHHPALKANRNSPRIQKAFEQLYNSTAIHNVVDKVSFNPPETASYKFKGSALHWDVSLALPIPFKLQGLLYLNDVEEDGGAFHCVPGFHLQIEKWLQQLPANVNPREEAIRSLKSIPIPGKAGDLIIWHQALPHCASPNKSLAPRFVQYITYDPDNYTAQEKWV